MPAKFRVHSIRADGQEYYSPPINVIDGMKIVSALRTVPCRPGCKTELVPDHRNLLADNRAKAERGTAITRRPTVRKQVASSKLHVASEEMQHATSNMQHATMLAVPLPYPAFAEPKQQPRPRPRTKRPRRRRGAVKTWLRRLAAAVEVLKQA